KRRSHTLLWQLALGLAALLAAAGMVAYGARKLRRDSDDLAAQVRQEIRIGNFTNAEYKLDAAGWRPFNHDELRNELIKAWIDAARKELQDKDLERAEKTSRALLIRFPWYQPAEEILRDVQRRRALGRILEMLDKQQFFGACNEVENHLE